MAPARVLHGWLPHLLIQGLLLLQVGAWGIAHQSDEEIQLAWAEGTSDERMWAFHVMSNRGDIDEEDFDLSFVRQMLADDDLRVRELAFTYDLAKMRPPLVQTDYIGDHLEGDVHHLIRCFLIQSRKVGGFRVGSGLKLQRCEFEWLLDAFAGRELPEDELWEHFGERKATMALRRSLLDGAGNALFPGVPGYINPSSPEDSPAPSGATTPSGEDPDRR